MILKTRPWLLLSSSELAHITTKLTPLQARNVQDMSPRLNLGPN